MIRLSEPTLSSKAIDSVVKVLSSGNLVYGEIGKTFEESLKNYLDVKHTLLVSSGTAALHLSLIACGIGKEDKVIVPAFTFPATANAVALTGATPLFVDVDPNNYCLSYTAIEKVLSDPILNRNITAILPVHEFGYPCNIEKFLNLAQKTNLQLIEDAACALGASSRGKKLGTFGDTGCFSFHPRKTLTTGEGGLICTNNTKFAKRIQALRNHGIKAIGNKVDFIEPGYNYRLSDIHSAIGCSQLANLDDWIAKRRDLAGYYKEALKSIDGINCPESHSEHSWQTYMVLLANDIDRESTMLKLRKKGIHTSLGAQSIPLLSAYRSANINPTGTPVADNLSLQGLALPFCERYDQNIVNTVSKALRECLTSKKQ